MIAVDTMTLQNGCLELVSGRYKERIIRQDETGSIHTEEVEKMSWMQKVCQRGDVMN